MNKVELRNRVGVLGVITTGRIGFSDTFRNVFEMSNKIHAAGVPFMGVHHTTGALWEVALTHAVYKARESEPEFIMFIDGDSLFTPEQAAELYRMISSDETIDAIYPVHADRNGDSPLAYDWLGEAGIKYDHGQAMTPVIHAHFGLTFIRTRVFDEIPEPWLWSLPGRSGKWTVEDGKRDADTYFWIKLHQHQKELRERLQIERKVVQANQISIGHMELSARWQVGGKVVVQTLREYQDNGPPFGLRNPYKHEVEATKTERDKKRVIERQQALDKLNTAEIEAIAERRGLPKGSRNDMITAVSHMDAGVGITDEFKYELGCRKYAETVGRVAKRFIEKEDNIVRLMAEKRGIDPTQSRAKLVELLVRHAVGDPPQPPSK